MRASGKSIGFLLVAFLIGMFYTILQKNVIVQGQPLWSNVVATIEKGIGLLIILIVVWYILRRIREMDRLDSSKDEAKEAKIDAIIQKLGITQEEIDKQKPQQDKKKADKVSTKLNGVLHKFKHRIHIKTGDTRNNKDETAR